MPFQTHQLYILCRSAVKLHYAKITIYHSCAFVYQSLSKQKNFQPGSHDLSPVAFSRWGENLQQEFYRQKILKELYAAVERRA